MLKLSAYKSEYASIAKSELKHEFSPRYADLYPVGSLLTQAFVLIHGSGLSFGEVFEEIRESIASAMQLAGNASDQIGRAAIIYKSAEKQLGKDQARVKLTAEINVRGNLIAWWEVIGKEDRLRNFRNELFRINGFQSVCWASDDNPEEGASDRRFLNTRLAEIVSCVARAAIRAATESIESLGAKVIVDLDIELGRQPGEHGYVRIVNPDGRVQKRDLGWLSEFEGRHGCSLGAYLQIRKTETEPRKAATALRRAGLGQFSAAKIREIDDELSRILASAANPWRRCNRSGGYNPVLAKYEELTSGAPAPRPSGP